MHEIIESEDESFVVFVDLNVPQGLHLTPEEIEQFHSLHGHRVISVGARTRKQLIEEIAIADRFQRGQIVKGGQRGCIEQFLGQLLDEVDDGLFVGDDRRCGGDDDRDAGRLVSDEKVIQGRDSARVIRELGHHLQEKEIDGFVGEESRCLMLMKKGFERLKTSNGKIVFVFVDHRAQIECNALDGELVDFVEHQRHAGRCILWLRGG